MTVLQIIYAPNPIFKMKAEPVINFDQELKQMVGDMFATLDFEQAIGIGANMVGLLKQIVVIDMSRAKIDKRFCLINPEIIWSSKEMQIFTEASLCFPGIDAEIERPNSIVVKYFDENGVEQELKAEGFLATVIQHEMDYLNGVVFLDHLSKMKRDLLLKKMQKQLKMHPPHVHGAHCHH